MFRRNSRNSEKRLICRAMRVNCLSLCIGRPNDLTESQKYRTRSQHKKIKKKTKLTNQQINVAKSSQPVWNIYAELTLKIFSCWSNVKSILALVCILLRYVGRPHPDNEKGAKKRWNVYPNNMSRTYCPSIFMVRVGQSNRFHKLKGVNGCSIFNGLSFAYL